MKRFREWYQKRRLHRACESIRYTLAIFEHDISGMSDEEIVERVQEFNRRCAEAHKQISLSAADASRALMRLAAPF